MYDTGLRVEKCNKINVFALNQKRLRKSEKSIPVFNILNHLTELKPTLVVVCSRHLQHVHGFQAIQYVQKHNYIKLYQGLLNYCRHVKIGNHIRHLDWKQNCWPSTALKGDTSGLTADRVCYYYSKRVWSGRNTYTAVFSALVSK